MQYILHLPSWFPDDQHPYSGNFIEKHITAISRYIPSVTLRVERVGKLHEREKEICDGNETRLIYFIKRRKSLPGKFLMKLQERFFYERGIKKICRQFGKPSLIHLHVALPMGIFATKWSRKWNIPLVLTEHWSIYQKQNSYLITGKLKKQLDSVYSAITGFTAVSENLREIIARFYPGKISTVIPNVVDTDRFIIGENTASHPIKKIIHISTLDQKAKNFSGIVNALKIISEKRNDFVLKVIHENCSLEAEEQVREYGLNDVIQFLGSRTEDEVALELRDSDFLLLFSNYENLPCVIIEAFACGKPVITTDVGGIAEIVNESRGLFVKAKDEKELAEKIDYILDHLDDYNKNDIRQYAENHFSPDVIGKQFFEFYKKVQELS